MFKRKLKYCLKLFLLGIISSTAQQETGNWIMYFGTNKINQKISVHSEVQHRNYTISPTNIEQLLLRTGLNYHFNSNASATIGYAHIGNHLYESPRKSPEIEEHRIWQQFLTTNNIGRVKFEHRYRFEQRFVESDFKMRFRYRLMLFYPLNRPVIEKGSYYIGIYDEVFINDKSNDKYNFFDRNRLYAGLGYQYDSNIHFQLGILRQEVETVAKTFLQFGMIYNTDLSPKKSTRNNKIKS